MAHSVESRANNPANRLRDALGSAEKLIISVNQGTVEELLVTLDLIQQMLWDMSEDGIDLRPELARWQILLNRVNSKPVPICRAASNAGGFDSLRAEHPPAQGVWWHLDSLVAERRRQSAFQTLKTLLIIVGVVGGLYWTINTFFPPDPDAVLMVDTTANIDQHVREEQWEEALAAVDTTLELLPEEPELWIWKTVLLEQLGETEPASITQAQAQQLLGDAPIQFWVALGNTRLQVGNLEGAEQAATQALTDDPGDPQAYFLMGGVAEMSGDIATAVEMFNKTYELAEGSQPELAVIARVRMGRALQQPMLPPPPPATQSPAATATP